MIKVSNLRVSVGKRTLVDGIGFTVPEGQVLALVGASGSGKTTTGLALLGETPAGAVMTGEIRVEGSVAYLPQHSGSVLNPVRRIGSVLREVARLHQTSVADALSDARLPADSEFLRRFPHQLSGGQQQRLVLALALLCAPSVIVADEPTTGLDAATRDEVAATLSRLGVTIVLLSHDLELVRTLADQVLVLCDGRVVEAGPAVLEHPQTGYARALVDAARSGHSAARPADRRALLEVRGLVAGHRDTVLNGVDLSVGTGERLAIVGRSGSGKTTLARCIAGLHPPTAGTIAVAGNLLSPRRSRRDLTRVQYAFQDARATFAPDRSVLEQVARTAVRLRGLTRADAMEEAVGMLHTMGLTEETVQRRPKTLSGGEIQRAALARAVLARPDVLICDEITSGLDPLTQAEVLDLLTTLDLTLIVITHDPTVVARIADRVVVIHELVR
jgi:peptide/nickel transport system ATP-binding protein